MLRRSILIVSLALFGASLAPRAAWAQAADARARAKELYQKGEEHLAAGRSDEAIQAYQAAYDLAPLPGFLYNLGQAWRQKGERERAIAFYERYLTVEPKGKASAAARANIDELRKEIAAEKQRAEDEARRKAEEQRRRAEEEQRAEEERQLREAAARQPPPDEPPAQPEPPSREPAHPGRTLRIAGYGLIGTGGFLVGLGIVFGLEASVISDELSEPPLSGSWTQAQDDRIREGEAAERNMYICYAVGAVATTAGVLLIYYGGKAGRPAGEKPAPTTALVPVVTPEGVALSFEGRFW
jgi:tetratricopeptide (TPR) repeat protein